MTYTRALENIFPRSRKNKLSSCRCTCQSNDDDDEPSSSTSSPVGKKVHEIPAGATTTDLPPGVLYKVRATYKYVAEDQDELNFEAGELIRVVEYDDPEEQEEGWLYGIKESTGEKGLFPANFTRPV